jgi:hypothetical protein
LVVATGSVYDAQDGWEGSWRQVASFCARARPRTAKTTRKAFIYEKGEWIQKKIIRKVLLRTYFSETGPFVN